MKLLDRFLCVSGAPLVKQHFWIWIFAFFIYPFATSFLFLGTVLIEYSFVAKYILERLGTEDQIKIYHANKISTFTSGGD